MANRPNKLFPYVSAHKDSAFQSLGGDTCSLSPGGADSDESEDASSGKNSVYRKTETRLKLRRNGKRKFTSGCFFYFI